MVNAIPLQAIKMGLLTVPKKNKKNVFSGRILEIEGLPDRGGARARRSFRYAVFAARCRARRGRAYRHPAYVCVCLCTRACV